MRFRSRHVIVAALVGIVALPVWAGPAGAAAPVLSVDQARADELISVAAADQGTFGGVSLDQARGSLTIRYASGRLAAARYRVGSVATLGAPRAQGHWRVELVAVNHSLAELETVRQRVASDRGWWQRAGGSLSEWYVDITRNAVEVGVTRLSPELTAAARATFGDLVGLHEAARPDRTTRADDWAPWGAGIRIVSGGTACTAGFFVEVPGTPASRKMVTAGHCFANGATVTNNGDPIGIVSGRTLTNNGKDVEYVGGNYTPWTYKGPSTSDYGDSIRGWKASVVGQPFCTNGARSGEVCSGTVDATNLCVLMSDGRTTCSLDRLSSNLIMARPGDSGGNLFAYDGADLKVGGIIIAVSGTTTYFHPATAVTPMGWKVSVA